MYLANLNFLQFTEMGERKEFLPEPNSNVDKVKVVGSGIPKITDKRAYYKWKVRVAYRHLDG